jgi:hypothetical protein
MVGPSKPTITYHNLEKEPFETMRERRDEFDFGKMHVGNPNPY